MVPGQSRYRQADLRARPDLLLSVRFSGGYTGYYGLSQVIHHLSCIASQAIADMVHYYLQLLTQRNEASPTVYNAARIFENFCYQNKDSLSAGIIVAGWDDELGPSVYNIPVGGGLYRQPWAIGGMLTTCTLSNQMLTPTRVWFNLCVRIL